MASLHTVRIGHLPNRYDVTTDELLDLIRQTPSLRTPLPGANDYIEAEVVSAAPVAAKLMGDVLGWNAEKVGHETSNYLKRVQAERDSQLEPDDESADRVRLEAPDIISTR